MRVPPARVSPTFSLILLLILAATVSAKAHAQISGGDGAVSEDGDDNLETIVLPSIQHAPFSLTFVTDWTRPLKGGGTYTVVNFWPIRRDGMGRIYEERWPLIPKGARIRSEMTWIQIADPISRTYYECSPRSHVCELYVWTAADFAPMHPELFQSGRLNNGKGSLNHEDLGKQTFAGVPVHLYRDTTTIDPGTMGNDQPIQTVRDYRFSDNLGINLTSVVDSPQFGRQSFTATDLTTTEPDPKFFLPPEGYTIIDKRKPASQKSN